MSLSWLRRVGAGERALKTALAVGIAWELGSRVPGVGEPYLAPLAALLSMQITIADSVTAATQRVLGIVVGVVLAIGVSAAVGANGITVGVLVLLALMAGSLLRLGPQGIQQVAVSALLLIAVGSVSSAGYAVARIVETVIGAAVGVGVNALLAPPSHLGAAEAAVRVHAAALAAALDKLATVLAAGVTPAEADAVLAAARETDAALRDAQAAVSRTEIAHRYNLWNRRERPAVQRLRAALRTQERVAIQARGIVRTIDDAVARTQPARPAWLEHGAAGGALADAVAATAAMVGAFPAAMAAASGSPPAAFPAAQAECASARERLGAFPAPTGDGSSEWIDLGSVLVDLDRIRRELAAAVASPATAAVLPATAPSDGAGG